MIPQKERIKQLKVINEIMAKKREKTLWAWFSKYIRLRDCIDAGFGKCVTCGQMIYFKDADAGHYIAQKNHYSVVYNEKNVHLQCKNCNKYLHGNVDKYRIELIERYGIEEVEALEVRGGDLQKNMPLHEVEAMSAKYRQLAKDEAYKQGVTI